MRVDYILVGDVGGTNCRLALAHKNQQGTIDLRDIRFFPVKEYASFYDAASEYLSSIDTAPKIAAFAFAGPKFDGAVQMTNADWIVTEADLKAKFGLSRALILNDFVAMANGARLIPDDGFQTLIDGKVNYNKPVAVLGPGTGMGLSLIVPGRPVTIIPTEGGHRCFAPETEEEHAVYTYWLHKLGYVSVENLLSGSGLFRLYQALCHIHGEPEICQRQEDIIAAGQSNPHSAARRTVRMFNSLLGAFAGDTALTLGASGGIVIAGGVSRYVAPYMNESDFTKRFKNRGSGANFVKNIPVRLLQAQYTALYGAADMIVTQSD